MIEYAAMLQRQLGSCQWLPEDIRRAIHMPDSAVPSSVSSRYMWALAVEEFLLLCELKNWESESVGSLKGCILLVTVNVIESKAVRKAFLGATQCSPHTIDINGFKYEHLGVLGGYEIIHVISGMGATGIEGAQETVRRSIDDVNPNVVLMVGIAFGVDDKKQKIGDILVSRQVFLYESQRRNKDSTIVNRGDTVTASPMLLGWASHAEVNWGDEKPSIHTGLILSGEKLVDNLSFRDGLVSMASEAIGGEMEAAGVYVACQNSKVEWLVIKAICDWANGEKNRNKIANQKEAAKWAAEFAVCIVGGK
jgi:nucleoside phosphorylase